MHSLYLADRAAALDELSAFCDDHSEALPEDNRTQHSMRAEFDAVALALRGLIKQIDLLYKLVSRVASGGAVATSPMSVYDQRLAARLLKTLNEKRADAVRALRETVYIYRQIAWLHDRFPEAELRAVPGLVRVVDRAEIARSDWSLSPGRYVGVAPPEEDEEFDLEQTLRDIHTELADLNTEAQELAAAIQTSFELLGI